MQHQQHLLRPDTYDAYLHSLTIIRAQPSNKHTEKLMLFFKPNKSCIYLWSCIFLMMYGQCCIAGSFQPDLDKNKPYNAWVQPYYNNSKQSNVGTDPGYRAYTYGFTLGIDKIINSKYKLGVAGGYAFSKQESLVTKLTHANIENYLLMIYGTTKYQNEIDFDWTVSGGQNYYDSARMVQETPQTITATANYLGYQYGAQGTLSKKYHTAHVDIIPQINANFSYAKLPTYNEEGAGELGNSVEQSSSGMFTVGTGIQTESPYALNNYTLIPAIHGLVYYNLNTGMFNSLVGFVDGGTVLNTPTQSKVTWQVGGSLEIKKDDHISIKTEYDLQLKTGYYNNMFFINFKYIF